MSSDRPSTMLNERLQDAMACLDLSLESELALYRRHRHQSLLALTESSRLDEAPEATPSEQLHTDSENTSSANNTVSENSVRRNPVDDLATNESRLELQSEPEPVVPSENSEDSSRALVPFVQNSKESAKAEENAETLPKPYGAEITAEPKAFERFLDPSIEDYLESSEALLKHLEESATTTDRQVKQLTRKSWATTLRNIAIAIGCLGVLGILGLLIVQWFSLKPRKPAPVPQVPQSSAQPLSAQTGSNPPLLTETVNAKPLNPSPSIGNVTPATTSTSASTSGPKPSPLSSPSPSPSPTVPSNANYAVVADYTNTESLQAAKKLVPDAFIAKVGGQQRIQLAWLDELQQAQKLVEDLKNEGFAASIVAQN